MSDPRRIPRVRSEEVQLQPGSVLMYVYIYILAYIYIYSKFSGHFRKLTWSIYKFYVRAM